MSESMRACVATLSFVHPCANVSVPLITPPHPTPPLLTLTIFVFFFAVDRLRLAAHQAVPAGVRVQRALPAQLATTRVLCTLWQLSLQLVQGEAGARRVQPHAERVELPDQVRQSV
jgi:hypothetical protein